VTVEIPSRRVLILVASVLVAGAIGISYAGFTRAPGLHAPPWIAYVLALIFLVTAARVFEMTSGHAGTGDWFALVFFGAGAVVEWWIAFGADPRWCSSSLGFLSGAAGCRVPFGIAACISSALALYCSWRFLTRNRGL
jgi:hypothetical protein